MPMMKEEMEYDKKYGHIPSDKEEILRLLESQLRPKDYEDMQKNAFLKFWFDKKEFEKDENFRSLDLDGRKQALVNILDENQLYLNYDEMDDSKYHVTAAERELTNRFYQTEEETEEVEDGE